MSSDDDTPAKSTSRQHAESAPVTDIPARSHMYELFVETTSSVNRYIPLQRAVLVAVGRHYRDLLAIAGWRCDSEDDGTRSLSLRLPVEESLFAQVAAQRFGFSDDYFGLFSGNSVERKLLLDGNTGGSYVIWPLRDDSSIVGLIGFSSDLPGAFTELEAIDPERTFAPLAAELTRLRHEQYL